MAISGFGKGVSLLAFPQDGAPGEVLTVITPAPDFTFGWLPAGGGGGAPTNAQYVTLALDATLTDERVLTAGTGISIVDGGPNGNVTINFDGSSAGYTLQDAYDAAPAPPQITVNNAQPVTIDLTAAANDALIVRDNLNADILRVSDTRIEGTGVSLEINDALATAADVYSLRFDDTYTQSAGFVGGGMTSTGTITYANPTWIWALLSENKGYIANTGAGFAAFTLFNAIPFIRNGTSNQLVQALILNAGVAHQSIGANAVTTVQNTSVNGAPAVRTFNAGGSMTYTTGVTGLRYAPIYGTVAGSSINYGTVRGVHCLNPVVGLFQPSAGIESMTAYVGLDYENITFGGNVTKRAVRSFLNAATNARFLDGQGTAQSDFRGSINFPVDLVGVQYGASSDWSEAWAGAGFKFEQQQTPNPVGQMRKSFPTTARFLRDWSADMEYTVNCALGFSLGAQTGANGNQFGNFVTAARTIPVGGDWADFLLTQAGSLTVGGLAMGRVSAWVINPVSYANSSGSVGNADTLTVGGFPTSSPGVTITERQSLHVIAGRSRFQSAMQFDPITPAALSAGDNNDWAGLLTGSANNNMRHWARLTGNATTSSITGIDATAAQDGDTFELTNVGSDTILLTNEDTGSAAANRILTPTGLNFVLRENNTVAVRYDATSSRWRVVSAQVTTGALSGEWQFDSTTTMADPGAGNFRNNNATIGSVTAIAINDEDKTGVDAGNFLAAVSNGDQMLIQNIEDGAEFLVFDVTSNTDNTGWHQIGGTVNTSGSNFTDGKEFLVTVLYA